VGSENIRVAMECLPICYEKSTTLDKSIFPMPGGLT